MSITSTEIASRLRRPQRNNELLAGLLAGLLVLTACGGGGGNNKAANTGGDTSGDTVELPAAPSLTLTPQAIKDFQFSWTDVSGETEYRLMENNDGVSGFTEAATIPAGTNSFGLPAFLPARINAQYLLQACNDAGCSDSNTVTVSDNLASATGYFKASNSTVEFEQFGFAVALSSDGDTLAVGARLEDSTSGAVYVFTRSDVGWSQQVYLRASNIDSSDQFGYSVTLSGNGNTLAVGAYSESSNATGIGGNQTDDTSLSSGAVYVFTRSGVTWSQQAYVKASNTGNYDAFGSALALSDDGNSLAVGAFLEDSGIDGDQTDNGADNSGAVYVFTRSDISWSQQAYLKASNIDTSDQFGNTVTLSGDGNTLAVGALLEASTATGIDGNQTDDTARNSGAVYMFTRTATDWSQQAYVKASNTGDNDRFSSSVALSGDGNSLAVGTNGESSNATGIDGDQDDNSASFSGAVYVFARSGAIWSQQAYVKASNTDANDYFGTGLALSDDGNTLAVGAYGESSSATGIDGDQADNSASSSGVVYVFTRSGTTWRQQAYVKASNTDANDYFGAVLAFSGDGNTLAVGAITEASAATGIQGDQTDNTVSNNGAVYLF